MTWLKRLDGTWQERYEIEIWIGKIDKKTSHTFSVGEKRRLFLDFYFRIGVNW
jgi:hypothetical protein